MRWDNPPRIIVYIWYRKTKFNKILGWFQDDDIDNEVENTSKSDTSSTDSESEYDSADNNQDPNDVDGTNHGGANTDENNGDSRDLDQSWDGENDHSKDEFSDYEFDDVIKIPSENISDCEPPLHPQLHRAVRNHFIHKRSTASRE